MKVLDCCCIFPIILLASWYVKAFKVTVRALPWLPIDNRQDINASSLGASTIDTLSYS